MGMVRILGIGKRGKGRRAVGGARSSTAMAPDRRPEAEEQNQKQSSRERKRGTTVERLGSGFGEGRLILLGHNPPDSFLFFWPNLFLGTFMGWPFLNFGLLNIYFHVHINLFLASSHSMILINYNDIQVDKVSCS